MTTLTAADAARAAITASGVEIRTLEEVADLEAVRRLYEQIWRTGAANPPITADLLRAMAKVGSYVSGAYDDGELVGACFGFFSAPERDALHSHIAGVLPRVRVRKVGYALKLHQRAWALERGAGAITWTYDPLIRRNAWFNLGKLAADVAEYLPDFYGPMDDDINRADPTDRILIRWPLLAPAVDAACAGTPRALDGAALRTHGAAVALEASAADGPIVRPVGRASYARTVLVGVPDDIEALREHDPALAGAWRGALREVLGGLLEDGGRVTGFDRNGWYIVERTTA
ncbi:hypothetical protein GCM10022237_29120 [Nocardioides ginsengisoli]|uniref:GNAT family N-acetyltransferase n=1 Tax=Nocardioides ginsengisoli TaxID=363868 RepID=A0ABW3W5G4_9ACTN